MPTTNDEAFLFFVGAHGNQYGLAFMNTTIMCIVFVCTHAGKNAFQFVT